MLLQPWVSSNISSPPLSESRWNRIKTVGNVGNTFESYGLTGRGPSQTSYNVAGAMFDICAAIFSVVQKGACVMTHMAQYPANRLGSQRPGAIWRETWERESATNSLASWQSKALKITWNHKVIKPIWDISILLSYCIWLPHHANVRWQTKGVCNQTVGDCNQTKATTNNWCLLNCLTLVGNAWNVRWMLTVICLYEYWIEFNHAKYPKTTLRLSL